MTNYEIAKQCRRHILNVFGQCAEYDWSADFALKELKYAPEKLKEIDWFIPVELNQLTQSELDELGFAKWDDSGLMLIPIWLKPFAADSFIGACIDDRSGEFKLSEIDNYVRYGCLAYGVYPQPA